jgi:hypothetical protein
MSKPAASISVTGSSTHRLTSYVILIKDIAAALHTTSRKA